MFWFYLIFSALVSKVEFDRIATAQSTMPTDQGLSTKTDGQMTNLLDALTIYRSVVSISPTDKCCDHVTMTPHLDLFIVFTRHVHAWLKYATAILYNLITVSTDVPPPCLPEAKPQPDLTMRGTIRDGFGGGRPPPRPPLPPATSSSKRPPQSLLPFARDRPVHTSLIPYGCQPPADQKRIVPRKQLVRRRILRRRWRESVKRRRQRKRKLAMRMRMRMAKREDEKRGDQWEDRGWELERERRWGKQVTKESQTENDRGGMVEGQRGGQSEKGWGKKSERWAQDRDRGGQEEKKGGQGDTEREQDRDSERRAEESARRGCKKEQTWWQNEKDREGDQGEKRTGQGDETKTGWRRESERVAQKSERGEGEEKVESWEQRVSERGVEEAGKREGKRDKDRSWDRETERGTQESEKRGCKKDKTWWQNGREGVEGQGKMAGGQTDRQREWDRDDERGAQESRGERDRTETTREQRENAERERDVSERGWDRESERRNREERTRGQRERERRRVEESEEEEQESEGEGGEEERTWGERYRERTGSEKSERKDWESGRAGDKTRKTVEEREIGEGQKDKKRFGEKRGNRKEDGHFWRTEITTLGSVMADESGGEVSPVLWLVVGTALGLGMAVVWNVVHQRPNAETQERCQHTGDLAEDMVHAVINFFRDRERPPNSHAPEDRPDPSDQPRRHIHFNETAKDNNDSLFKRMRRLRKKLRRERRRRKKDKRRRRQLLLRRNLSSESDSQTPGISSESSSTLTPLDVFSASTTQESDAEETTETTSTTPTMANLSPPPILKMRKPKHEGKLERHRKRKGRGKRKGSRGKRWSGLPTFQPLPWKVTCTSSDHYGGLHVIDATSSESTTIFDVFGQHLVDNVQPDMLNWEDSSDYSQAHSVGERGGARSTSPSTSPSLTEEFTGPWVSTSLSFVVYDLDVIDDIPDEVLEVLSCDEQPCEIHPHDRYHYVGSKIIVQRLPLPTGENEHNPSSPYIPHPHLSVSSTNTIAIRTAEPLERATPKKHVRKADRLPESERVFVSRAINTDSINAVDSSMQTVSEPARADFGLQTYVDCISTASNTDILQAVHSSVQTVSGTLVNAASNTAHVAMIHRAQQASVTRDMKSVSVSTETPVMLDSCLQTCLPRTDVRSSAINTVRVDVADFGIQASLIQKKRTANARSQTASEPQRQIIQHRDASTETITFDYNGRLEEIDEVHAEVNEPHEEPPTYPQRIIPQKICAPAAKAASAGFQGSDFSRAMTLVKDTYEGCLRNPSAERYPKFTSPSPKKILPRSPIRARRSSVKANPPSTPSSRKESPEKHVQTPGPDSPNSVGNSVALAMNTIKEVYDRCMTYIQSEAFPDSSDYPYPARANRAYMSDLHEHGTCTVDKLKHAPDPSERISSRMTVSPKQDPWEKYPQDSAQIANKSPKERSAKCPLHKTKLSVTSTHPATDKSQAAAKSPRFPVGPSSGYEGHAKVTGETPREKEAKNASQRITVNTAKSNTTTQQCGPCDVVRQRNISTSSPGEKITDKSGSKSVQAERVAGRSDLFKELKEKVAQRQSFQGKPAVAPSTYVPVPQVDATTIKPATRGSLATSDRNKPGIESELPTYIPRVKRSDLRPPFPEPASVSTQKICNQPQSKKDRDMDRESSQSETPKERSPWPQKQGNETTDEELSNKQMNISNAVPSQREETRSLNTVSIVSQRGSDTKAEQTVSITSHAKDVCLTLKDNENPQSVQKVCITSPQQDNAQSSKQTVCLTPRQQEKTQTPSQKALSPQKVCVLSPQKIYVTSQQKDPSHSPQKVCIISQQNKDGQTVQKVCITTRQEIGVASSPTVCIIPKQKRGQQSPTRISISHLDRQRSPLRDDIDHSNDTRETVQRKPYTPRVVLQMNKKQDSENFTNTQNAAGHFQQVLPSRFSQTYAGGMATADDRHEKLENLSYDALGSAGQLSKTRPWGNLEQLYERQRKRSIVIDDNPRIPITTVAKNIKDVYDGCMTGKFKPRKAHQTRGKNTRSQTKTYQQFDEGAYAAGLSEGNDLNKEQPANCNSKQTKYIPSSNSEQQTKTQEIRFLKRENETQNQAGDSPFPILPLAFPFASKSSGQGPPSPAHQDSSNSAERVSSETLHKEQTRLSSSQKKPYHSLSRVNMRDPSPPLQVSDRAKNNVFSPVGWISPRAGITSLFRAPSNEKMGQLGHNVSISTSLQTRTSKEIPNERFAGASFTDERESKSSAVCTAGSTQSESQHKPKGVDNYLSKNTCSTGLHSSVRHDHLTCGHSDAKHYCSLHPDMVEIAKGHVTGSRGKILKQPGPVDYRPRIMSRPRVTKQSKSPVPRLLKKSSNKLLPSKPDTSQFVANQSIEGVNEDDVGKKATETTSSSDREIKNTAHKTSGTNPETDQMSFAKESSRKEKVFQQREGGSTEQSERGNVTTSTPMDLTLTRNMTSKYRLCRYTNDIIAEFKDKLNTSSRPSQIIRGKRKSNGHTSVERENVRTTISSKCNDIIYPPAESEDVGTTISAKGSNYVYSPKPKSRLPVLSSNQSPRKDESIRQSTSDVSSTDKKYPNFPSGSSATTGSQSDLTSELKGDRLILHPDLLNKFTIKNKVQLKPNRAAGASKPTSSADGSEPNAVKTNTKPSRIPVSKTLSNDNGIQRHSVFNAISQQTTSACHAPKAVSENAHVSLNSHLGFSENQSTVQGSDKSQFSKEANNCDNTVDDPTRRKRTHSRLPVAVPSLNSSSSSRKCFLSETQDKIENRPVSPLIAERIKRLQTSVSEGQPVKTPEARPIKKRSYYRGNDAENTSENKTDTPKGAGETAQHAKPKDFATISKRYRTVDTKPDGTCTINTAGLDASDKNKLKSVKENCKVVEGQSHAFTHPEGNISQNYNWNDLSIESADCSHKDEDTTSFSLWGSFLSSSDVSASQVTSNAGMKTGIDEKAICCEATPEEIACNLKKELKDLIKANGGQLYPSRIKQHVLLHKISQNRLRTKEDSSSLSVDPDYYCAQNTKTEGSRYSNDNPAESVKFERQPHFPHKSLSASGCATVKQVSITNDKSSRSCEDQKANSRTFKHKFKFVSGMQQNKFAPHIPCESDQVFDSNTDSNGEHSKSILLDSCHLSTDSLEEMANVIGSPQANSSFVDESDLITQSSSPPDSNSDHYHGFASGVSYEDIYSLNIKHHAADRVGVTDGNQPDTCSSVTTDVTSDQGCDMNELSSVTEVPVAGSPDVMSTFWKPGCTKKNSLTETTAKDLAYNRSRAEEMLHLMDDSPQFACHGQRINQDRPEIAWILKQKVNRISAKGDNLSVLNTNASNTNSILISI